MHGEFELRSKFWGKNINVFPMGRMELDMKATNEKYVWNKGSISVNNIVFGALSINLVGEVTVKNENSGDYAKIRFLRNKNTVLNSHGEITGRIYNSKDQAIYILSGLQI